MTMNLRSDSILNVPIGALAKYKIEDLHCYLFQSTEELEKAKRLKKWVESAVAIKYEIFLQTKRMRLEKDTGVIHIEDADFRITQDIAKKIDWDQNRLKKLLDENKILNANLADYFEITYHLPEAKYLILPEKYKKLFADSRIIRQGNPTYKVSKISQEVAI